MTQSIQPLKVLVCPGVGCNAPLGIHNDQVLILGTVRVYQNLTFTCGGCGYVFRWELRVPAPTPLAGYSEPVAVTNDGARLRKRT